MEEGNLFEPIDGEDVTELDDAIIDSRQDNDSDNDDDDPDWLPEDEELKNNDIAIENSYLKGTTWKEGAMNRPKIGGAHLSRIPLRLVETSTGEGEGANHASHLEPARDGKMIQSGQIYIPFFKKATKKAFVAKRLTKLGALPAMVQDLLMPSFLLHSRINEKKEIVFLIKKVNEVYENLCNEIKTTKGNNCVRTELFFKSNFARQVREWQFPQINMFSMLWFSEDNSYFSNYQRMMKDVIEPLMKVFVHNPNMLDYEALSPSAKRILVLCAELAVQMTEFHPFVGRITESVNKHVERLEEDVESDSDGEDPLGHSNHIFHVPQDLLDELSEAEQRATGLRHGLSSELLSLPRLEANHQVSRLSANDLSNRSREHIQMFQNERKKKILHMDHYAYQCGVVLKLFWMTIDDASSPNRSFFDYPNFQQIAQISFEMQTWLILQLTRIIATCYDLEWFLIAKTKTLRNARRNRTGVETSSANFFGKAHEFPTTVDSVEDFVGVRNHIRIKKETLTVITTTGELECQ